MSVDASLPVAFMGDPHGDFSAARNLPPVHAIEALIVAGDLHVPAPLDELASEIRPELWWIPGNHDYDQDGYHDRLFASPLATRNLHGRVVEIAGLRVAGLGGVFVGRVWNPREAPEPRYLTRSAYLADLPRRDRWRDGLPRRIRKAIWYEDVARLARMQADVLVCHEAPSCHKYGFAEIDALAEAMGVRLVVHGHHHTHYTGSICGGRIAVLGLAKGEICRADGTRLAGPD
ncbi:MAG: metallophosphoesterase [Gammaproteobacteria bacterium]|nr:MAG: metallophosphoesterase [Gammaproteobacteria bacterium]